MLTSFRGLCAASLATAGILFATPAMAQDDSDGVTLSANVAVTTDYRFRGVSLSAGDFAVQGGADVALPGGFYVGTWASTIEGGAPYGDIELDLYAGWAGDLAEGIGVDVGLLYYTYPDGSSGFNVDYWEPYASVTGSLGPAEATFGVAYAWDQDSLGSEDNFYIYTDLSAGIPTTPLSLNAHLGYTDGVLAPPLLAGDGDDTGFDYSLGISASYSVFELSVAYVGVEGPSIDGFTDDTIVATLTASF